MLPCSAGMGRAVSLAYLCQAMRVCRMRCRDRVGTFPVPVGAGVAVGLGGAALQLCSHPAAFAGRKTVCLDLVRRPPAADRPLCPFVERIGQAFQEGDNVRLLRHVSVPFVRL